MKRWFKIAKPFISNYYSIPELPRDLRRVVLQQIMCAH